MHDRNDENAITFVTIEYDMAAMFVAAYPRRNPICFPSHRRLTRQQPETIIQSVGVAFSLPEAKLFNAEEKDVAQIAIGALR